MKTVRADFFRDGLRRSDGHIRFVEAGQELEFKSDTHENGKTLPVLGNNFPDLLTSHGETGNYPVDVPELRAYTVDRIANSDLPDVEVTPEMIEEGAEIILQELGGCDVIFLARFGSEGLSGHGGESGPIVMANAICWAYMLRRPA